MAKSRPVLDGKSVLIVDDSPDILGMYQVGLEQIGMQVLTATDPQSAIDCYCKLYEMNRPPKFVILDAALSRDATGFDVAEKISAKDVGHESIILMLTAYALDDIAPITKTHAIMTGIEKVLSKPKTPEEVMDALQILALSHRPREIRTEPIPVPQTTIQVAQTKIEELPSQPSSADVANQLFKKVLCLVACLTLVSYIFWRETNEAHWRGQREAAEAQILRTLDDEKGWSADLQAYIFNLTNHLSEKGFQVDPLPDRKKHKEP